MAEIDLEARIQAALYDASVTELVESALQAMTDLNPVDLARFEAWLNGLRLDIVNENREAALQGDLEHHVELRLIDMKTMWVSLNSQVQYCWLRDRKPDPRIAWRAAITSQLTGAIEGVIDGEVADHVEAFLAERIPLHFTV